jgi:hypothetical protein
LSPSRDRLHALQAIQRVLAPPVIRALACQRVAAEGGANRGSFAYGGVGFYAGKLWSIRNFYRTVWDPARHASHTDFTLYDLRHTFASRFLAAHGPPRARSSD